MAAVVAEHRPPQPRSEQNTPAAFVLALAMHLLLVGALWVSVQWHTEPAGAVVVELWGAAPAEEPAIVAPPPPPPAPPRVEPEPERPTAEIVVEKRPPPKAEPPPDTAKIEAEKRRVEEQRQRAAADARRREAEKKQLELERTKQAEAMAKAAERRREDERREAVRKAEEARMLAQAGSGSPGGTPGAGGRGDAGYAALLAGLIKPRIVFAVPDGTSPGIYADFEVDLLPTGEILAVRLIKPSGLPGYDAAVERAIRRTDPFPRKPDGTVERTMRLTFRPVEK
jgi:colicin import membrane protein